MIQRPSLFQSGLLSSRSDALNKVSEKPYLEMHPDDAQALNIEEGEVLQITTRDGTNHENEGAIYIEACSRGDHCSLPLPDHRGRGWLQSKWKG